VVEPELVGYDEVEVLFEVEGVLEVNIEVSVWLEVNEDVVEIGSLEVVTEPEVGVNWLMEIGFL